MKKDTPPTIASLMEVAAAHGFVIHNAVGNPPKPVISVDRDEDVIRFFRPELQAKPWGNDLSGCIGLALRRGGTYPMAICHHVLNYIEFVQADKTVDEVS